MATEIVGSLFGVTPEMFQQRQAEMADRQALEYAQLSPLQRASFNLARGGYQLAGALGGQDPQLQMISRRQAIARQIDPTNLNSMQMGIQALAQAGDQVGAMQLAQVYQQRMKTLSDIAQNQAAAESSRASTGKTLAETESLRRKETELLEATKEYRGQSKLAQQAPANAAATAAGVVAPVAAPVVAPVAAPVTAAPEPAVQRSGQAKEIFDQYGEEAARFYEKEGYFAPSMFTPLAAQRRVDPEVAARMAALEASAKKFREDEAESRARFRAAVGLPPLDAAAPASMPAAVTASAPVAQAAQIAAAAPGRQAPSDIAAQAAAARDEASSRVSQIEARLSTIRRARAAGVKDAELEGKQLEDELKSIREASKPTPLSRLIAERDTAIRDGADVNSSLVRNFDAAISKETGQQLSFGERANRYALSMFNGTSYINLTPVQQERVNKRITDEDKEKAKSGAATFPGDKALADIPAFRRTVQQTIDPQLKTIYAARQALQSINDSIATNNFVSFNAARTQLARSLGDSQLSRRDIEQAGGDPSILGGLIDVTSRAFTSTPSIDTQKKIRDTLQAIQTVARRQARGEVDQQRRIALRSPGYNAEAVNEALTFPELQEIGVPSVAGGDLAARAAAELARRAGANNGR